MDIRLVKQASTIAVTVTATLLTGCATTSGNVSSKPVAHQEQAKESVISRKITVHTEKTIKQNWGPNRLFALIEPKGDRWELISVSTRYPARREQQEIFLITKDLSSWETTVANEKYCGKDDSVRYSVCTSALATQRIDSTTIVGGALAALMTGGISLIASGKSMQYDKDALSRAVLSIPEEQATAVVTEYIAADSAKMQRESVEKAKLQKACLESYTAGTQHLNDAASRAQAAAQAGKQLGLSERAIIANSQMRLSSFSACPY